jgi:hypothetical protein
LEKPIEPPNVSLRETVVRLSTQTIRFAAERFTVTQDNSNLRVDLRNQTSRHLARAALIE